MCGWGELHPIFLGIFLIFLTLQSQNYSQNLIQWKWVVGGFSSHSEKTIIRESSENSAILVLIFWSSILCVF